MVSELARSRSAEVCAERKLARWAEARAEAEAEFPVLAAQPEFMFGLALYVGEGNKAGRERLSLSNCDPAVLRKAIAFFREYLGVSDERIRAHVIIHEGGDAARAQSFWQRELRLDAGRFYRTVTAVSRSSRRTRITAQPYGTCHVTVYSTRLKQKVNRWMELALDR